MAREKKKTRQQRLAQQRAEARRRRLLKILGIGGLLAAGLAVLILLGLARQATIPPANDLSQVSATNIDGPADAPVKIVEFGDFGCPSCRAWHRAGIKRQLQAEFGDRLAFVFRHFPVITAQSPQAAEAAQCAGDQGAFWLYHDYLYEEAVGLAPDQLVAYAGAIGLDTAAFEACFLEGRHRDYVRAETLAARDAGARGTPTFKVNDQLIAFPDYGTLAAAVRAALP